MHRLFAQLGISLAASFGVAAFAAEPVTLVLNWVAAADHAPLYYAKAQGWYAKEGLDLKIESGKGSAFSSQRVGSGSAELGIAELATAFNAKGKGADLRAVMAIYANSPQGFYWLKSSGIADAKAFAGRKIGNPPGDAARVLFPVFASKAGIEPSSVSFVNISPPAKVAALKSRQVDIISDFYNEHDVKLREFGADLGFVAWRDVGINPYGNSFIVNGAYLAKNRDAVHKFVAVTQRAYAACVKDEAPCLEALMTSVTGLTLDDQRRNWSRIKELMRDGTTTSVALGAFDAGRLKSDYELVQRFVGIDKPFDVTQATTNDFLDKAVKMPK